MSPTVSRDKRIPIEGDPCRSAIVTSLTTVYLVDDDEAVRNSICLLLELGGFVVRLYASAEEFLRDERPDGRSCVITDMNMPGRTGLQLIEQLRREGNRVPAIVMTGDVKDQARLLAERLGALIIEKPFRPGELVARIKQSLSGE